MTYVTNNTFYWICHNWLGHETPCPGGWQQSRGINFVHWTTTWCWNLEQGRWLGPMPMVTLTHVHTVQSHCNGSFTLHGRGPGTGQGTGPGMGKWVWNPMAPIPVPCLVPCPIHVPGPVQCEWAITLMKQLILKLSMLNLCVHYENWNNKKL